MKARPNPIGRDDLAAYWRPGRENIEPLPEVVPLRFDAKQIRAIRSVQAERVYLNNLADYMIAHPTARVAAGDPWPVVCNEAD